GLGPTPSLATQVGTYLAATGGSADPNALYAVWAGANDLFAVQADPSQAQAIIGSAIGAEVGAIGALQQAGARYVLVANMPDIGLTPAARAGGELGMAQATGLAEAYNEALFGTLASQGLSVIPVDTFHFLQEVVANPGAYGFTNVTTPACATQPAPAGNSSLFCNPGSYVSPGVASTWMFADGIHPTTATHAMMAQLAVSMIEGPRQMAVLPHVESAIGRARAGRVDARLASRPQGDGWRGWAGVRGHALRSGHGDGRDGTGPRRPRGSGNLVYGGFLGYGRQESDWGRRRGSFEQADATLGGYLGWRSGQFWANGQLSYSRGDVDTEREVQLGQATRTHLGSTDGSNLSAGASAGWDF